MVHLLAIWLCSRAQRVSRAWHQAAEEGLLPSWGFKIGSSSKLGVGIPQQ